jgi:hypothetical protein
MSIQTPDIPTQEEIIEATLVVCRANIVNGE